MAATLARWRTHALALIAIAFTLAWMPPGAAEASTYDITSCNSDGTAAGWAPYGSSSFQEGIVCPYTGDMTSSGLAAANVPNAGTIASSSGGLMFKAPTGTSLVGIGTAARMQRWDSSYWLGLITASGQNLYGFAANEGAATRSSYTPNSWFSLNREGNVRLEVGCAGLCDTGAIGLGFRGWAQLYGPVTVRVEDDEAPAETLGGDLVDGTYATGTRSVTYDATDASGIHGSRLYVDGTKLRDDTRACNFEQPVPCSNVSGGSYSVDTTVLSDGSHDVRVETVDAAGNVASRSRTFSVDNHAPAAPSVAVPDGEGWRNSNSFAATWTNAAGEVAPVVKAHYQVCRAGQPDDCLPMGVQNGTNINLLSGVAVPGEGDYTLTVWLEDAAGNTSVANASAPVHLRYDASAPARVADLQVSAGESWRSTNSFDLSWTNPAGQLAPITSAHYRLCDEGGACANGVQNGAPGMSSLRGVHVPGPGAYTLTLWAGDEAGNSDPSTPSAAVKLRFDDTEPGEAQPQTSKGWLGAAVVVDGYDEAIRAAVAPPSGIAGYAVTLDGSEPGAVPNTDAAGVFHIADVPEGAVTVEARVISNSGVASSRVGSTVLHVDKSAPEVSAAGTPDRDAWQPQAVTIALRGSDSLSGMEGGHLSYSVDGGPPQTVAGANAQVNVAEDGEHTVSYSATDAAGNTSASDSVSFKLDTTPPGDASLADPGHWLSASEADDYEQPVASTGAAPLSGVAGYSLTTDGSFPDDTVDVTEDRVKLASLPEGSTVVEARAVSGSGLASRHAAAVTLRVDRSAPALTLHGAPDPERWEHNAVRLTVEASDALSGMDDGHVEYIVDDGDPVAVPGGAAAVEVAGDGRHTVRYGAVDAAGNRADERVATFRIDGAKPGAAQPSSSDGWVTDAGPYLEHVALPDGEPVPVSGLAGFSVTTDGTTPDESPEVGPDGVLSLDELADGVTTVKARAVSGAGAASDAIGSGTIKVDRTAPGAILDKPGSGSPRSLVARVSDGTSGLAEASIEFRPLGAEEWHRVPGELHDGVLKATLGELPTGTYAVRVVATDVAGNQTAITRFADGSPATLSVDPPAPPIGGTSSSAPMSGPAAQAPLAKPVTKAKPVRCKTKSKRSKRSHRGKHAKRRAKRCAPSHRHKGGEKHRHPHLGGKTHKPARGSAG